ncbi:hypothetical protein FisN_24Hh157 [Fistulifera solaris]|jgi:hypothetical protein|uniref:Exostosin GT47 domain-containing protein n=1 Tax=Fistulifera solaris TaxID=1519565 RepID=A0A1Z5JV87_FISSO|nr:hypothetical protein FisN_24Hh157 [Fistulifera solaris]|eukprot:GAX17776.1 hypothetical protein FisN_24Hh157 [Fistulifera solaris]
MKRITKGAVALILLSVLLLLFQDERSFDARENATTTTTSKRKTNSDDKSLTKAMEAVVRLLLPEERVESYLQEFPKEFRFYVYDSLPSNWTWQYFSTCIEQRYNVPDWFHHVQNAPSDPGNRTSNCDWGASICSQTQSSSSSYSSRRFNRNGDVVLSKIFTEYRGSTRTFDAQEADVFIVPYPSTAHCACVSEKAKCWAVKEVDIQQSVLANLPFLTDDNLERHVFLSSVQREFNHPFMMQMPLLLSLEMAHGICPMGENCGHILQPYVNTNADYQPDHLRLTPGLQDRRYAVTAFMSGNIGERSFRLRYDFLNALNKMQANNATIGGLPVYVGHLNNRMMDNETAILEKYRESIFCPCLRGNTPAQKRFFDVLMSGCIPVVIEYASSKEEGYPSFFKKHETSIRLSYPFAKGIFLDEPEMGIDYHDLVVTVNGTCEMDCMLAGLEDLIINYPEVILAKQKSISELAQLFSYGLQNNALRYPDAVAAMLVQIRHYVSKLPSHSWS